MNIERDIPLAPLTTFRIGGPADYFARVTTAAELGEALAFAGEQSLPHLLLGGGSNIVFADSGYRGLIIKNDISFVEVEGTTVRAGSGTALGMVVGTAARSGLAGLEKLAGLPGSLGGAVAGNAGSYGQEICDVFERGEIVWPDGRIEIVGRDWFQFAYRNSRIKVVQEAYLASCTLRLQETDADLMAVLKETAKTRGQKEPGGKNAGSFWKNPPGDRRAWELIDACGLRGHTVGGAQVSEQHTNYLVNTGDATAADIVALAEAVETKVQEKCGITLEREVRVIAER